MKTSRQLPGLAGWLLLSLAAGAIGAIATVDARTFYALLQRPVWAPPGSVFGPVWTTLYIMMGIAAWLVWRRGGFAVAREALLLFILQLALNALWSWLFFAWRQGAASFAGILVLWLLVVATLVEFWRTDRIAGWLMLPYIAWVSFAAALNFSTWQMNPVLL